MFRVLGLKGSTCRNILVDPGKCVFFFPPSSFFPVFLLAFFVFAPLVSFLLVFFLLTGYVSETYFDLFHGKCSECSLKTGSRGRFDPENPQGAPKGGTCGIWVAGNRPCLMVFNQRTLLRQVLQRTRASSEEIV